MMKTIRLMRDVVWRAFLATLIIFGLIWYQSAWAAPVPLDSDYINHFQSRATKELQEFTRMAGWTSQVRGLSPSNPLGVWGLDVGVELTTIPEKAFRFENYKMELPPAFPRLNIAKGITRNLDGEVSFMAPGLLKGQVDIPDEIESLWVVGGSAKYTFLREENYFISLAGRASLTRLGLSFFKADVFGADASLSRSISFPLLPITLTPYVGGGYVSSTGEFDQGFIPFVPGNKIIGQNIRYFGGASLRLFIVDITGQADFSDVPSDTTYSVKVGLDIDSLINGKP